MQLGPSPKTFAPLPSSLFQCPLYHSFAIEVRLQLPESRIPNHELFILIWPKGLSSFASLSPRPG